MVLSSQSPRPEDGRKFMMSTKSVPLWGVWTMVVVPVVVVVVMGVALLNANWAPQGADAASLPSGLGQPGPKAGSIGDPSAKPAGALAGSTLAQTTAPAPPVEITPVMRDYSSGMKLVEEGKLIEGRKHLSALLFKEGDTLSPRDAQTIRDTLASINKELVFSKTVTAGDPLTQVYVIQQGDFLSKVGPKFRVPYQFIEQINGIDARRIYAGMKIKVVNGPFHAVVSKSAYRMDFYLSDPEGNRIYVSSLPVGLGEGNSTPTGSFIVRSGGKVANPSYTNPRTGEQFTANDPKNPVGEYWLALQGTTEQTKNLRGYGIHGTIEPDTIGRQASMGCIRLRDADIRQTYHMLSEGLSTVEVRP